MTTQNINGYEEAYRKDEPYFEHPNDDTANRINQMLKYIRKGWSRLRIIDKFAKEWDMTAKHAYRYYHDAILLIKKNWDKDAEDIKNIQLERIEQILADCLQDTDRKTALSAIDMINRLASLYVEKKEVKADISEWKFDYAN